MTYNIDFLIAAMVILLLVLWYFLGQKRAEDLNNQVFLFFAVIGILDVVAELASNYYISFPNSNCEIAAMLATTIFYLLQALLPFTVICYIQTLHDNKIISAKKMFLSGVPTFILMGMILTNSFTEKLFYFDIPAGYMKGPWYMLMYYSALCHMAAALILIVIWRKKLGYRKVKVLLEILLISGAGVVIQLLYHPLLTTGFGMSLGILALFITINNPHANIDTLTGLYNHLYLVRKSNELISAEKSFHIITVYLYQLRHINKIAGLLEKNEKEHRPQVDISFPEIEKFDHLPTPHADAATAFVSIMEGCSKYCSYCVVPYTRGEEFSRPVEDVLVEIAQLAAQGVKDL